MSGHSDDDWDKRIAPQDYVVLVYCYLVFVIVAAITMKFTMKLREHLKSTQNSAPTAYGPKTPFSPNESNEIEPRQPYSAQNVISPPDSYTYREIKNDMDYNSKMSTQSTAIQSETSSTTPSTYSTRNENKWQMYLLVMVVSCLATICIFIKSLIKHKAIASRLVTTRLFIISFIESKACFIVLIAFSLSTNSALSITTGGHHVCALQTISSSFDGFKCWGSGGFGRLGSEDTANIGDVPNAMGHFLSNIDTGINIDDIIQVTAGYYHTCILTNTGKVKCYGGGYYGRLGYGNTDNKGDAPNTMGSNLPFIDLGRVIQIAAGGYHTCALLNDGTTPNVSKCFGDNLYGQLGYEDTQNRGDEANEMGDNLPSIDLGTDFDPIHIIPSSYATCALSR
eukprot:325773_1